MRYELDKSENYWRLGGELRLTRNTLPRAQKESAKGSDILSLCAFLSEAQQRVLQLCERRSFQIFHIQNSVDPVDPVDPVQRSSNLWSLEYTDTV